MKNILYVINLNGEKIAFTNGREYIRFVNGNAYRMPIAKAIQVGLFDENAVAVDAGTMDHKKAYFLRCGKYQTVAFTSELARAIHAQENGLTGESFFEATCYNWASDVNLMLNKKEENEGC